MIKGIFYSIKQAFKQIFRNKGMSLTAILAITAMLFILAAFLTLTVNVNYLTENIKDQFGTIEVFLLDEMSRETADNMITGISGMDGVANAQYIDKDMAMKEFKARWGNKANLLDGLTKNPLPNSIRITLDDLEAGDIISSAVSTMDGVEEVRFYKDEVEKVLNVTNGIQKGAIIMIIILVIVSIIVVSNTVKLTVMAREEEMRIMTYIGATNWFIRGPMFFEGVLIGFVSALIATGLSALAYIRISEALSSQVAMLFSSALVEPRFLITNMAWIFVALGIGIGACGSIVSMRRYLRA